jgi:hypothetical protein
MILLQIVHFKTLFIRKQNCINVLRTCFLVNNKGDKDVCCTEYYSNIVNMQQIIYTYIVCWKTNVAFGKTSSLCLETHVYVNVPFENSLFNLGIAWFILNYIVWYVWLLNCLFYKFAIINLILICFVHDSIVLYWIDDRFALNRQSRMSLGKSRKIVEELDENTNFGV